ncbi:MAG: cobalamin biosynthesis protein CobG [Terracoccus sp.]
MSQRPALDRCPSLARPFRADDGALVRLRVPGGRLLVATLVELLAIATDHGAPVLQLTSRGNLQMRALPDPLPSSLVARLEESGLFPSASHEGARNVIASPCDAGISRFVDELDAALVADPDLAELPGRFLFAVSTPDGAVLGEPWDMAYETIDTRRGRVLVGPFGVVVPREQAVAEMLHRAHLFLRHRRSQRVWNVRDLPNASPVVAGMRPYTVSPSDPLRPGVDGDDLVAGVPLGMLRPAQVLALSSVTAQVTITPWRSLVVEGGAVHESGLAAAGFVTSPRSPWSRLSACVGAPSCRRTDSPTLDLTTAAAGSVPEVGPRIHVVGCERRCGHPSGDHVTVLNPVSVLDVLAAAGENP